MQKLRSTKQQKKHFGITLTVKLKWWKWWNGGRATLSY